jgi:hypothetical protein
LVVERIGLLADGHSLSCEPLGFFVFASLGVHAGEHLAPAEVGDRAAEFLVERSGAVGDLLGFLPTSSTVEAAVSMKKALPNTVYEIYLVQGMADCSTVDGTFTMDGRGAGSITVSEPSTSTHAAVALCALPTCAGTQSFVTETYNH